jgi:hypothetical protein
VADTNTPLDHLVDLLVYAPVGIALTIKDDLGAIIERGRRTVAPQVQVAKFMGRLAFAQASRAASDLVEDTVSRVAPPTPPPATPATAPAEERVRAQGASGNGSGGGAAPSGAAAPDEAQLAIPGYDSLSAAQVVQRLGGLRDVELDAVRHYEEAHRGRRTILGKVDQLQSGQT